jgi:hypothetical protein
LGIYALAITAELLVWAFDTGTRVVDATGGGGIAHAPGFTCDISAWIWLAFPLMAKRTRWALNIGAWIIDTKTIAAGLLFVAADTSTTCDTLAHAAELIGLAGFFGTGISFAYTL